MGGEAEVRTWAVRACRCETTPLCWAVNHALHLSCLVLPACRFDERETRRGLKAGASRTTALPTDKLGRIKPGVRVQDYRPEAPRNTTQVTPAELCVLPAVPRMTHRFVSHSSPCPLCFPSFYLKPTTPWTCLWPERPATTTTTSGTRAVKRCPTRS